MIIKGEVLLPIPGLQQGRGWIAAKIGAHLVHFIQTEHGVAGFSLFQVLDNLTRERADICPSMPPDLGLVPDTSKTEPDKISPHASSDGFRERCLADSRCSH